MKRRLGLVWLVFVACSCFALTVDARPGSGQNYEAPRAPSPTPDAAPSPSPRSSSGHPRPNTDGGDEVGGGLLMFFVTAHFTFPQFFLPAWVLVLSVIFFRKRAADQHWNDFMEATREIREGPLPEAEQIDEAVAAPNPHDERLQMRFERIEAHDPEFSRAAFEDFLSALFIRAHETPARERGYLRGYISAAALKVLERKVPATEEVVVEAFAFDEVIAMPGASTRVRVTFEASLIQQDGDHRETLRATEVWNLVRASGAQTRAKSREFGCPHCGEAYEHPTGDTCTRCDEPMGAGENDWSVTSIEVLDG